MLLKSIWKIKPVLIRANLSMKQKTKKLKLEPKSFKLTKKMRLRSMRLRFYKLSKKVFWCQILWNQRKRKSLPKMILVKVSTSQILETRPKTKIKQGKIAYNSKKLRRRHTLTSKLLKERKMITTKLQRKLKGNSCRLVKGDLRTNRRKLICSQNVTITKTSTCISLCWRYSFTIMLKTKSIVRIVAF